MMSEIREGLRSYGRKLLSTNLLKKADEMITLSDFEKKFSNLVCKRCLVRWANKAIPEIRNNSWFVANADVLPDDIAVVTNITKMGTYYVASYWSPESQTNRQNYLPADFFLSIVEDDTAVMDKYFAFTIRNLGGILYHGFATGATAEFFAEDENGKGIPSFVYAGSNIFNRFSSTDNSCLAWTIDYMAASLRNDHLALMKKFPKARLSIKSTISLSEEELKGMEDSKLKFKRDVQNAYGLKPSLPDPREMSFRGACTSIRANGREFTTQQAQEVTKALDATLGVMCVSLFAGYDEPRRRLMYGLPGDYKSTNGVYEYYAMPNTWLCHPFIANLVFDYARKCVAFGEKGCRNLWKASEKEIIDCMMECDVDRAHEIMNRNEEIIKKMIQAAWGLSNSQGDFLYKIMLNGVASAVKDPKDLVTNWNLNGSWIGHSDGINKNVSRSINDLMSSKTFRVA